MRTTTSWSSPVMGSGKPGCLLPNTPVLYRLQFQSKWTVTFPRRSSVIELWMSVADASSRCGWVGVCVCRNVLSSQEVVDFISQRIKPDESGHVRSLSSIIEEVSETRPEGLSAQYCKPVACNRWQPLTIFPNNPDPNVLSTCSADSCWTTVWPLTHLGTGPAVTTWPVSSSLCGRTRWSPPLRTQRRGSTRRRPQWQRSRRRTGRTAKRLKVTKGWGEVSRGEQLVPRSHWCRHILLKMKSWPHKLSLHLKTETSALMLSPVHPVLGKSFFSTPSPSVSFCYNWKETGDAFTSLFLKSQTSQRHVK